MDRWDALIIFIAGYVAVVSLVRLMATRRNDLIKHVQQQLQEQQAQKKAAANSTEGSSDRDVA